MYLFCTGHWKCMSHTTKAISMCFQYCPLHAVLGSSFTTIDRRLGSYVLSHSIKMGTLLLNMLRNTYLCVISSVLRLLCHHQRHHYAEKFLIMKVRYLISSLLQAAMRQSMMLFEAYLFSLKKDPSGVWSSSRE